MKTLLLLFVAAFIGLTATIYAKEDPVRERISRFEKKYSVESTLLKEGYFDHDPWVGFAFVTSDKAPLILKYRIFATNEEAKKGFENLVALCSVLNSGPQAFGDRHFFHGKRLMFIRGRTVVQVIPGMGAQWNPSVSKITEDFDKNLIGIELSLPTGNRLNLP